MRRMILSAALALATLGVAQSPQAVVLARPTAVQIFVKTTAAGKVSYRATCSGAVVRLERGARVVSAGHCVDGREKLAYSALDYQGKMHDLTLEQFEMNWPKQDYAIFASAATDTLPALNVAAEHPGIGQDVYSWSGPMGLGLMLFHGEVSGQLSTPHDPGGDEIAGMWYSSNLLTDQGASGSVVLNDKGEAVSILVGGFNTEIKLAGAFFAPLPK